MVIPVGIDFEFLIGDGDGVTLGVVCFGDFDPKFQNEWDFFDGDNAGEACDPFVSLRWCRCRTLGVVGGTTLRTGVCRAKVLLSDVLCVGVSEAE
jgi:hypothetical protein